MNKFLLSSAKRTSGTSNEGSIPVEDMKGIFRVLNFTITDGVFNVTDNNNRVYVRINDTTNYTVYLTNKYYTGSTLATELQSKLNSYISGSSFTVVFHSSSYAFVITETSGDTFAFTFGTNTTNSARKILGFPEQDTTSEMSLASSNVADLAPAKTFFCIIKEDSFQHIRGFSHFHASIHFTAPSSFGGVFRFEFSESDEQILDFRHNPSHISYRFVNQDDNSVDFNGCEWTMMLQSLPCPSPSVRAPLPWSSLR